MQRRTRIGITGLLTMGLSVAAGSVAVGQQGARSGAWTLDAPEGDWYSTGRDYSLQRFSPLKQITTANVKDLKVAWTFSTGTLRGHEGSPLVIGNVMYVNTPFPNIVYALDLAKPGAPMIWKYVPNQSPDAIPIACCDVVNRGIAYHPSGKIFVNTLQGELIALDAKTGKELWKAKHPERSDAGPEATGYKQGATMTNAPIVIKDLVITGISGGEFGVRGRVSAFDVNSGSAQVDHVQHGVPTRKSASRAMPTPTTRPTRARTSASRPGRATSGSVAAARPGAGTPTTPSWTCSTTAPATRAPGTPTSDRATTSGR